MYSRIVQGFSRCILFEIKQNNIKPHAQRFVGTGSIYKSNKYTNKVSSNDNGHHEQVGVLVEKFESIPDNKQWDELRNVVLGQKTMIDKNNIDAIVLGFCSKNLNLTKSYVNYLKAHNINPNFATIGKILKSYHNHYENKDVPPEEIASILGWCEKLLKLGTLDFVNGSNVIHGLVLTERWKESLKILDMIKITSKPKCQIYSIIVSTAFNNSEIEIGWNLFDEMLQMDRQPTCSVYESWINYCLRNFEQHNKSEILLQDLEKMLKIIADNDIRVSKDVGMKFVNAFEKIGWTGNISKVVQGSNCKACKEKLAPIKVLAKDFKKLQKEFLNRVLIRKDVFVRSNPTELENFRTMIKQTAPYDVVIDGLNVAFCSGKKKYNELANILTNVVQHFTDLGKNVLVLGRKHMIKWSPGKLKYLQQKAHVFLTEDLSFDDLFLLQAAISSGPKTIIVSRDLMRGHRFLLEDSELRETFKKWQLSCQYQIERYNNNGTIILTPPLKYLPSAQKNDNGWHIPIVEEYKPNTNYFLDLPQEWICLRAKT